MIRTATVTDVTAAGVWVISSWLPAKTGPLPCFGTAQAGDAVLVVRSDDGELLAVGARPADGSITSAQIADGTIVNADVNAAAGIDKTKISGTAITAADTGSVTSAMIANGTIVNDDINNAAAIAVSKLAGHPTTTTDNGVPRFDSTGGALQTSALTISDIGVLSGLAAGSESTDAATKGYVDARLPVGAVTPYAGSSAPSDWLLCHGQAVSRTTYAALYAVISTTYGTGDGSTTFNVPDLRGRTVAGVDNMGGSDAGRLDWSNTRGTTGGAQNHTLSAAESGVPAHGHGHTLGTGDDTPDHAHGYNMGRGSSEPGAGGAGGWLWHEGWYGYYTYGANTRHTHPVTGGITNNTAAGAASAHNNMQPTMLLNWIIRT